MLDTKARALLAEPSARGFACCVRARGRELEREPAFGVTRQLLELEVSRVSKGRAREVQTSARPGFERSGPAV